MINVDFSQIKFGQQSGYGEFFEWDQLPKSDNNFLCRLVQFSPDNPSKIQLAKNTNNLIGVTTISCGYATNNPQEWPYKYYMNPYGDLCLEKKNIAIGVKEYDEINELAYISTKAEETFVPAVNQQYQENIKYINRYSRKEWIQVIMLGQCIIEDDGNCKPGEYCTLYQGNDESKFGTVVPAQPFDSLKIYVLERIYKNTIICLIKNI